MPDLEDDLRATADDIAADAARLEAIEEEKLGSMQTIRAWSR